MYHDEAAARRRHHRRLFAGGIAAAVLLAGAFWLEQRVQKDLSAQSAAALKQTVLEAVVQCYAVEGAYPESVAYLEESYGLQINHNKFYVTYDAFASNQMPDIQVLSK